MNLYEGVVDSAGGLTLGSQRLDARSSAGLAPGTVLFGIRPEDLTLATSGEGGTLGADVRMIEQQGSELHAFFALDAPAARGGASVAAPAMGTLGQAYNGVARLDPRCGVRPGDRVTFGVDPGRLYFFAPGSGAALAWPEEEAAVVAR
jgi:ABC-type sugar transport system ATPase subunit